jgi:hypothetical protein
MPDGGRYHLRKLERKNVYLSVDVPEAGDAASEQAPPPGEAYRSALSRIDHLVQARKPPARKAPPIRSPAGSGTLLNRLGRAIDLRGMFSKDILATFEGPSGTPPLVLESAEPETELVPGACAEEIFAGVFANMRHPALTNEQRRHLEEELDQVFPAFERSFETDHFALRWTEKGDKPGDVIDDPAIISETADHLEEAYRVYEEALGIAPYVPADRERIDVVFYELPYGARGSASPPDGPIQLNSRLWKELPGIRRPTSAHELFHKVQYAVGFRRSWPDFKEDDVLKWFSEGTASWAEVHCVSCVSDAQKISGLFANPDYGLYRASYGSTPFWMHFEALLKNAGRAAVKDFLTRIRTSGDPSKAIEEALAEPPEGSPRTVRQLYRSFVRAALLGDWQTLATGQPLYASVFGPDAKSIEPQLMTHKHGLARGAPFKQADLLERMGADVYEFTLPNDGPAAFRLTVSVKPKAEFDVQVLHRVGEGKPQIATAERSGDVHGWSSSLPAGTDWVAVILTCYTRNGSYTLNAAVE